MCVCVCVCVCKFVFKNTCAKNYVGIHILNIFCFLCIRRVYLYIYIYIYMCVCVFVCACDKEITDSFL